MYRLSKLPCVALSNIQGVTLCPKSKISVSDRTCSLYKQLECLTSFSNGGTRYQSTHTNPSVITKKPRKKRTKVKKTYAEMLVVGDNSTSECKARIHKLKPDDIKMLALTNLDLSELYKLNYLPKNDSLAINEHTYSNLNDLPANVSGDNVVQSTIEEFLPKINSVIIDELQEQIAIASVTEPIKPDLEIAEDVLISKKVNVAFQPEVPEEEVVEVEEPVKEETVKKRMKPIDLKAKAEIISRSLSSYIEVCVGLKAPQRGFNAYNYHRYRHLKSPDKFPKITSLNVVNALLKGFAAKGDFIKLQEVLKYAQEDNVILNVQSYAAIFECLARVNCHENHRKFMRIYSKQAIYKGITFDTIMNEATFLGDQRERVLETMKMYDPNYKPKYWAPSVQFCNHLVDTLNHEDQLKGFPMDDYEKKAGIFNKEHMKEMIKKQLEVEKSAYVTVKSIESRPDPTEEVLKFRQAWKDHVKLWEEAAVAAFNRDLAALSAQRSAMNIEPYMRSIPTKDFITIIVDEAQKIAQGSETYSPTVNMLYRDLGNKVYARFKVLKKQKTGVLDKVFKIHSKYCDNYVESHSEMDVLPGLTDNLNTRQKWQWAEYCFKQEGATIQMDHKEWVPPALMAIGKFLYNIVMHDIKIDVNVLRTNSKHKNYLPAFYTIFRNQGRIVKEEVKPHPILSRLYRASVPETLTFPAYEIPMKCPPIPWVSINTGGYLIAPCEVVRLPTAASSQKERLSESVLNKLYPSLDALNQLGSIPWKVNKDLLDVILEVFKNGGSSKLDVPEHPSMLTPPPGFTANMDKSERYAAFKQKLQYKRKKAEMYSLWCDCLYRLSLANHFREDIFWLPHNMDFRGRVYPIPPHLNHLGSDLARSMLVFAEGRPLGPNGLDWLKLHLINLTGLKKRDKIDDRLAFANSIMDDILDSAERPLNGRKWWAESEEPWQTLACCMEIAAASRSEDPEKFVSYFPVHQDGSCNGLQHYAALGRDSAGAFSVNLTPAPVPQDVYSAVAVLVEEKRKKDAENGIEIAKILDGFVKRKVIKQTVMTTVYGVTRFGARLQIARQLKDIDDFPKESVWAGSSYLTTRTFDSLRTMFTSTREIQDWFTECARLISSVCGQNVEWVTPMGLPIVQPYFRYKKLNNSELIQPFHMDKFEKPNVMKQKNAFPPNFIHSLDSSHMMLTSLYCERAGITFVSVHDCYWTHPSTVHIMNKICREQFVALHSEPILEELSAFLSEKFSYHANEIAEDGSVVELTKRKLNRVLRKLPKTGNFDINEVLKSVYFFS